MLCRAAFGTGTLERTARPVAGQQRGHVVIASDCCHLYSHIDEGRVFPITYSVGDTLEGYKKLLKLSQN